MTRKRPIHLVVGCDTDPDRLDFGGIPFNSGRSPQTWRGVEQIPELRRRLNDIRDSNGRTPAITWFLRCDEQMRLTEGGFDGSLRRFRGLWDQLREAGDEIGWHPHFWRLASDEQTWFHEIDDPAFQHQMLVDSFHAFTAAMGTSPCSVRMGWDYHSNRSMQTLAELGIRVDLSALPLQAFPGSRNDRGASFAGLYDWSTSSSRPYRPSREDYRIPGADALDILELPQNLLQSSLAGFLSEVRGAVRDRSLARIARASRAGRAVSNSTVKACSPPMLFRAMVHDVLRRDEDWIVTYFHPDELLPRKGSIINDLIHRMSYFVKNVMLVTQISERLGRPVEFLTATQAADRCRT